MIRRALIGPALGLALVAGCATHAPAPVEVRGGASADRPAATASTGGERAGYYVVKKGDTLYSIALDHGQDYRDVAAWNAIENPNLIKIGQSLRVIPPEGAPVAVAKPVSSSGSVEVRTTASGSSSANTDTLKREPKGGRQAWSEEALAKARQGEPVRVVGDKVAERPADKPIDKPATVDPVDWIWPAGGKLISGFADGGKGIDIAGKAGEPVLAAAAGVVSYAGSGLRGYGNLIVLRHSADLLSVYAHNSRLLVKEKESVARGQKIAEIGSTDAESPRLHFEIRRQGKPADPLKYLPSR